MALFAGSTFGPTMRMIQQPDYDKANGCPISLNFLVTVKSCRPPLMELKTERMCVLYFYFLCKNKKFYSLTCVKFHISVVNAGKINGENIFPCHTAIQAYITAIRARSRPCSFNLKMIGTTFLVSEN